jgi:hypothetical protein
MSWRVNKGQVHRFFQNLRLLPTHRFFNMDATGRYTVLSKRPNVDSLKEKTVVRKVASAERRQLMTAVCCPSAASHYDPPP